MSIGFIAFSSAYSLKGSKFTPLYLGKCAAYAALTRTHLFIDGVRATLAGFANFSDSSYLLLLPTSISFEFNAG
jgi:hypothetical protein